VDEFHRRHELRYGYEDSARPTQVVNVRVRVTGPSGAGYEIAEEPVLRGDAREAKVDALATYVDGRWQDAPVYDRQRLRPGDRIPGPALVAEYSATTVIPADFAARVDGRSNLILRAL
jgi:N-methylhydantoinase A